MHCFSCNARIPLASGERIGFRDVCTGCDADLHVCKNCAHHDPTAYNECRESSSERVSDRVRANRCDYFVPCDAVLGDGALGGVEARDAARSELASLFKK